MTTKIKSDRELFDAWCKKHKKHFDDEVFEVYVWDKAFKKEHKMSPNTNNFFDIIETMINSEYPSSLLERYKSFKNTNPQVRSLERYQLRYGLKEGKEMFDSYCNKQAKSNTFEYKQEKYGWTKEQFDKYNSSRAVTLENMIKRYGEEEGHKRFGEYVKKQRYAGVTLEYFVEKYGEEEGRKRFGDMIESKMKPLLKGIKSISSKEEMEVIESFEKEGFIFYKTIIGEMELFETTFINSSYQFSLIDNNRGKFVFYDGFIPDEKILLEFNGDLWHYNKRNHHVVELLETKDTIIGQSILKRKDNDDIKKDIALDAGFRLYVIWEMDWNKHKDEILQHFKAWSKGSESYYTTEETYKNESC